MSQVRSTILACPLNEGRGINPGDTRGRHDAAAGLTSCTAQRRPGHQPRRHSPGPRRCVGSSRRQPLNEGRGINPGDTGSFDVICANRFLSPAQRRPGHQPRRHSRTRSRGPQAELLVRSTKAGASTPATRRPGAPRSPRLAFQTLNEGRGINPGDTSTKRPPVPGDCASAAALNEGRGINPGDTHDRDRPGARAVDLRRSTKAGASTPATPLDSAKMTVLRRTIARPLGVGASTTTRLRLLHVISDDTRQNGQHQAVETALTAPGTRGFRESLRVRR